MSNSADNHELQLERFEAAWREGRLPQVERFYRDGSGPDSESFLGDLIEIDYEYRLKRFSEHETISDPNEETVTVRPSDIPTIAGYLVKFPELVGHDGIVERLVVHEYELRQRWGDRTSVDEFLIEIQPVVSDRLYENVRTHLRKNAPIVPISGAAAATSIPQRIGAYKIVKEIASGGMGSVFLANQEQPVRRQVALKVIKAGANSKEIISRFEAERQALAMMSHPNIAQIFDGGTTEAGAPYFVMEFVDGIPMAEYCDSHKLTIRQRLELFIPVCHAIQHAHQKGIIHRDLKPSNVLIAEHDGKPVPKVIDFGLAKALEHATKLTEETMATEYGAIVGTIHYMSPEQAGMDFLDIDTRTDVYSLGVMLYELLTGSTPLDRTTLKQQALLKVLEIIREKDPPRPSDRLKESSDTISAVSESREISPVKLRSILSGELDWVVMKALEKERERRYSTANDFAIDVERFLNNQTVTARPPSAIYRTRKFVQRNRGMLAASALVILTILVAGLITVRMRAEAAIANVEKQLSEELTDLDLSVDEWQKITGLVADVRQRDVVRGDSASQQMSNAMLVAIAAATRRPRMSRDDRQQIVEAIARVTPIVPESSEQLSRLEELKLVTERLEGNWSFAFAAGPDTPAAFQKVFAPDEIRAGNNGLLHPQKHLAKVEYTKDVTYDARLALPAPLTRTRHKCEGDLRVEAVFGDWESCHEVGLTLYEVDDMGYDFVVSIGQSKFAWNNYTSSDQRPDVAKQNSFADASQSHATVLLEIRRGDKSLLRHPVAVEQLADGPIRIAATRQGNVLTIGVNDLPERSILDPFPFRDRDEGYVGIRGTIDAGLESIRADERRIDDDTSPLTAGDSLFRDQNYSSALDAYQEQITQADPNEDVQLEALFKSAICLLKLGRTSEGNTRLSQVQLAEHSTWSALATITLWDEALKEKRYDDATTAFTVLKTMGALQRAASLTSEETKSRIVDAVLQPLSMQAVLKMDNTLLPRVRQAAEIDRALSYDGQGSIEGQMRFSQSLRLEGRHDEACELLRQLTERTDAPIILNSYLRALRVAGRADEALAVINERLLENDAPKTMLYHARTRTHVALGDLRAAEADIALGLQSDDVNEWGKADRDGELLMMRGFLKRRRGDEEGAVADWRKAFERQGRVFNIAENSNHSGLILGLMLGSLTDQLTPEHSTRFTQLALEQAGYPEMSALVSRVAVNPERIHATLSEMWKSPRGLRWAEAFAFENADLRERISKPVALAVHEYLAVGAFPEGASAEDREQCWIGAEEFFEAVFQEKTISLPQCLQLVMAWKGRSLFGSTSLPSALPDAPRARLGYLFGHHFLAKNDGATAKEYFAQVTSIGHTDEELKRRTDRCLKLLKANQGAIKFAWQGVKPLDISIRNKQGEEVDRRAIVGQETVAVAPGDYDIHLGDNTKAALSVKARLGKVVEAEVDWDWNPSQNSPTIPGLVAHPAKLRGLSNWQVVRSLGAAKFYDLSWNPVRNELAVANGDNVIRIVDESTRKVVRMFSRYDGSIKAVDWSPDGSMIAVGDVAGRVYLLTADTGRSIRQPFQVDRSIDVVRWNPDGHQLAAGSSGRDVFLLTRDGTLQTTLKGHTQWVKDASWSPDGSQLATASPKEVIIWDLATSQPLRTIANALAVAWGADRDTIAVATMTELMLLEPATGKVIATINLPDLQETQDLNWSADGNSLLVTGWYQGYHKWTLADNPPALSKASDSYGGTRLGWNHDKSILAMGASGGCYLTDVASGTAGYVTPPAGIYTTGISTHEPDTHVAMATASFTGRESRLQIFDPHNGTVRTRRHSDQSYTVTARNPVRPIIAAATRSGLLWVGDIELHELTTRELGEGTISHLVWNAAGDNLYVGDSDGRVLRLAFTMASEDGNSVAITEQTTIAEHDGKMQSMAISADETMLAISDLSNHVQVRSIDDGEIIQRLPSLSGAPKHLQFSPSGNSLVSAIWDHVQVWDASGDWERSIHKVVGLHPESFAWLNDKQVLFGSNIGAVTLTDFGSGETRQIGQIDEPARHLVLKSNGKVAIASPHGVVRDFNVKTERFESTAVSTWDGSVAVFTDGGALLTGLDSLEGLSCIIETDDGQTHMSAKEFFEQHPTGVLE